MRRKRVRYVILTLVVLSIGVCVCQRYFDVSITAEDVDRIQGGMTFDEVTVILHSPPTNVNGRPLSADVNEMTWEEIVAPLGRPYRDPLYVIDWEYGSGAATVCFDATGHAYGKGFYQLTALDRFRGWWMRQFGTAPPF